ncbi:hypothetical protein SteCoe_33368 [Stentor coeruleus]|uniref:Uncharacterized protein n=1 Tax=Stentor coeruleus TaxID=5963 RepID=A0A1R2AWX6_9CILI|nr:hypothetical protein SteCoe_33368 [Stentor coeruleus]
MQVKKPSPNSSLVKSRSRPKIISPQKSIMQRASPAKNTQKNILKQNLTRDYFNYTPLRQNKSATCLTPDLVLNKSMRKEAQLQEIFSQKKIIMDQGKILQQKLKDFKSKVNKNSRSALSSKTNIKNLSLFINILDKNLTKLKLIKLAPIFSLVKIIYERDVKRPQQHYKRILLKKCFKSLSLALEKFNRAITHYHLQLLLKTFLKWSDKSLISSPVSVPTNDSILDFPTILTISPKFAINSSFTSNETSATQLVSLSEAFYSSSLLYYKGFKPWKKFFEIKNHKRRQKVLAKDNFICKILLKSFHGLFKNWDHCVRRPKVFRRILVLQKSFNTIREYDKNSECFDEYVQKFREFKLVTQCMDGWKIFVNISKVEKVREIRNARIRRSISEWRLNKKNEIS